MEKLIIFTHCNKNKEYYCAGYLAKRGILDSPPWIELFDNNKTRFEFEFAKDALAFVWDALAGKGIKTLDMN
jgi:hypothetical protein